MPVLVTTYVKVAVPPTAIIGPVAVFASWPLVDLTTLMPVVMPKWLLGIGILTSVKVGISMPDASTGLAVTVALLVYCPAVTVRVAVYVHVSVSVQSAVAVRVATLKRRREVVGRVVPGVPLSSVTATVPSAVVPVFVTT